MIINRGHNHSPELISVGPPLTPSGTVAHLLASSGPPLGGCTGAPSLQKPRHNSDKSNAADQQCDDDHQAIRAPVVVAYMTWADDPAKRQSSSGSPEQ